MAVDYPLWYQLKQNIKTALETIATEEAAVDAGRNFKVEVDQWRPWIEAQQSVALVNILVQAVNNDAGRSGSRRNHMDTVSVYVDMYALGEAGEILPVDGVAAKRLDLLNAQVREGLTRLAGIDLGFSPDPDYGHYVDWDGSMDLTVYDQDEEQTTGQYAPARWTMNVNMPFIPVDNNDFSDLEELNLSVSDDDLALFALRFNYTP